MRPPAHAPVHLAVSSGWQWGFGIFHFAMAARHLSRRARSRAAKMVAACCMCYGSVTWPVVAAMQDGLGKLDTTLAAFLTMGLGLIAVYVCAHVAPKLRHAMDWYGTPAEAAAPETTTAPAGSERALTWQP